MRRRTFRLASVLRLYELRKQRAEMELAQASRALHELEREFEALVAEITAVATMLHGSAAKHLSTTSWIAAYGKTLHLDRLRQNVCVQLARQTDVVAKLQEEKKKWAVREETLISLRHRYDAADRAEAEKAEQLQVDETVLRRWGGSESQDVQE
jgi:flagellar export protein FliJ